VFLESSLSVGVLVAMSLLPLMEIFGRLIFGRGMAGSIPLVQHLTLWCAFLGAALAARSRRLLALSTADFLPKRWRGSVRVFTSAIAVGTTTALFVAALQLIRVEWEVGETVALGLPLWVALLVMPVGLAMIGVRLVTNSVETLRGRWLVAFGSTLPVIVAAFPLLRESSGFVSLAGLALVAATALGLPIYAALGGAALLLFWSAEIPIAAVSSEIYRLSAQPMLPAVPLFTLAGFLLAEGGASRRLLRTFTALFGWMPGGIAIVTTILLAFFTPLTGASGVTILSMGGILLPVLLKARYPESTSVGLVTVSGSIGLLFVPSLPVILYGVYAKTPIDELFIGGLIPGLLLVTVVAAYGAGRGWLAKTGRRAFRGREAVAAVWEAKWELVTPIVIVAGIFGGFATLVEAAALTVIYALIVEVFIYRDLDLAKRVPPILVESATLVGGFLIILSTALAFTNTLIHAEVPLRALEWVRASIESPIVFLLALNLLLIVVGALMDIYSAIFVLVPLIAPMGAAYGIDPVHLGVIFLANMELGYLMPPMGENLFLSSYRFKQPLARVYLSSAPFVLILLIAVLVITYVPELTLWPLHFFRS
jgi:tripartite ATP-independent transporter DctM subunit